MQKPLVLIAAPFTTASGYGAHSRDLISSLLSHKPYTDRFDFELVPLPWGDTPQNALKQENEMHMMMLNKSVIRPTRRPDIFMHIALPNEFKPIGKYNIGITAGAEVDKVSDKWIEAINTMDMIITPSKFTTSTFENTRYDKLKVIKPIKTLFEGVDTDLYKQLPADYKFSDDLKLITDAPENYFFLYTGHWIVRKNVEALIYNFLHAFKGVPDVALALKTSGAGFSIMELEKLKSRMQQIIDSSKSEDGTPPAIYLIHGNVSDKKMNEIYNHPKIKTMISTTHGEGYGRPLAEFASLGKPVLAPNWSGHLDFLNTTKNSHEFLFDVKLSPVPKEAIWKDIIIDGSRWADPTKEDVVEKMTNLYFEYDEMVEKFLPIATNIRENMSFKMMQAKFIEIIDKHMPKQQAVDLDLSNFNFNFDNMKKRSK